MSPGENFEKKIVFRKNKKFHHFRILGPKFSIYRWKIFDSVVESTVYVSRRSVCEEIYFLYDYFS